MLRAVLYGLVKMCPALSQVGQNLMAQEVAVITVILIAFIFDPRQIFAINIFFQFGTRELEQWAKNRHRKDRTLHRHSGQALHAAATF